MIVGPRASAMGELTGEDDSVPSAPKGCPQGLLGAAAGIDIGSIDVIDAPIESGVDDVVDLFLRHFLRSKAIGADANDRHANAGRTQLTIFHCGLLSSR